MQYVYDDGGRENAGFKGKAGDCVVRAVAIATQQNYQTVYDALSTGCRTQRKTCSCGPAKGNSHCPICKEWMSEGCNHSPMRQALARVLRSEYGAFKIGKDKIGKHYSGWMQIDRAKGAIDLAFISNNISTEEFAALNRWTNDLAYGKENNCKASATATHSEIREN